MRREDCLSDGILGLIRCRKPVGCGLSCAGQAQGTRPDIVPYSPSKPMSFKEPHISCSLIFHFVL